MRSWNEGQKKSNQPIRHYVVLLLFTWLHGFFGWPSKENQKFNFQKETHKKIEKNHNHNYIECVVCSYSYCGIYRCQPLSSCCTNNWVDQNRLEFDTLQFWFHTSELFTQWTFYYESLCNSGWVFSREKLQSSGSFGIGWADLKTFSISNFCR